MQFLYYTSRGIVEEVIICDRDGDCSDLQRTAKEGGIRGVN